MKRSFLAILVLFVLSGCLPSQEEKDKSFRATKIAVEQGPVCVVDESVRQIGETGICETMMRCVWEEGGAALRRGMSSCALALAKGDRVTTVSYLAISSDTAFGNTRTLLVKQKLEK